jgi:hypothetical protein
MEWEKILYLINRKILYVVLGIFLTFLGLFYYSKYSSVREDINNYHNEFKRFLYLLENAEAPQYKVGKETLLQISSHLKLEKINKVGNTYELVFSSVPANRLVFLIYRLEKYGEIEEISAVDNSGKGFFHLRIVLKLYS